MGWLFKQNQRAKKRLPNPQRMMTLVIMKMMSLMMSKWFSTSRTLGSKEEQLPKLWQEQEQV
jgi:hypothetical protein